MIALLAQAASSSEWHDGWQLAVITFTSLTIVAGWIHRQSKSDLKAARDDLKGEITAVKTDLTTNIDEVKTDLKLAEARLQKDITEVKTDLTTNIAEVKTDLKLAEARLREDIAKVGDDLKDLKDKLYDDARSQVSMYQWQLAATQPTTSEGTPHQSPPKPKQLAETTTD